ncbi:hypothetical protein [Actinacidiphila sp. ITFR-21]|uniref:hypothetical protein n=1 Tax=Actinacidiphila sp. ITFR-21 TaxID=3075199 RepID=UPI00288C2DE0|nr:hypothetical protein [Streptomyces sp. ITFR-21]WNI19126.1 hypothetical protein RLT57_28720 [Streptomyces sp. ITFR-21]
MSARTFTPDVRSVNAEGRAVTTVHMKRGCNGCGTLLGDIDDRDVDDRGNLTDVRAECPNCAPVVELEKAGCRTWRVTERSVSNVDRELDRLNVFAKGYWQEVGGKLTVVGLRVGIGQTRVVAYWGDWLVRHPDGHFTVLAGPQQAGDPR